MVLVVFKKDLVVIIIGLHAKLQAQQIIKDSVYGKIQSVDPFNVRIIHIQ